jgi:hypothetical protein
MKIYIDDECVLHLNETQLKTFATEINIDSLKKDLKRRVKWILQHKYDRIFERFKKEWEPKLAQSGIESIPLDKDKFAELVFNHPDYKCRKMRDAEGQIHQQVWDNQADGDRPRK